MRILVAITGASGLVYGVRTAEVLKRLGHEVFVVVSEGARKVAKYENVKLPKSDCNENELDAPFASGSYKLEGMILSGRSQTGLEATLLQGLEK
ncbi:MAG: flavoprotein [Candidatus Anstonellales archaeon]